MCFNQISLNKSFDPRSHSLISKKRREVSNQYVHMCLGAILDFARGSLQDNPNIGDRLNIGTKLYLINMRSGCSSNLEIKFY